MREASLGELVQFVLDNKRDGAFVGYEKENVASSINTISKLGVMRYVRNDAGVLCGLVLAYEDKITKVLHITDVLTTEKWVMKAFVQEFKKLFPGYTLAANRNWAKHYVIYKNTERLCNLLMKGSR